MNPIQRYILGLEGQQKAIVSYLHERLIHAHDLDGKIRYKVPMYYYKSWICYLNPIKHNGIEVAFLKGYLLSNVQGLLVAKNRKMVMGIDLFRADDIPEMALDEIIREAVLLDEMNKK